MLTSSIGDSAAAAQPRAVHELEHTVIETTQAWVTSLHFLNSLAVLHRREEQESL